MDTQIRILVVCQNKGGDGKSTLTRLVAEFASRNQLRVLLIDMDPQCNLSKRFLAMETRGGLGAAIPPVHPDYVEGADDWDGRSSIADAFTGRINKYGLAPYPTPDEHIDILPGSGQEMREAELVRREEVLEKIVEQLRVLLHSPDMAELYDLVVIDTPPAKSPLVQSAIRAATHMVIPTQMAQQSIEGLHEMILQWRIENRNRPAAEQLQLIGVLPNKCRPVAIQTGLRDALGKDKALAPFLIPMKIGERTVFAEADHPDAQPKSVFDLPTSDKARQEATAACSYILHRMQFPVEAPAVAAEPMTEWVDHE